MGVTGNIMPVNTLAMWAGSPAIACEQTESTAARVTKRSSRLSSSGACWCTAADRTREFALNIPDPWPDPCC